MSGPVSISLIFMPPKKFRRHNWSRWTVINTNAKVKCFRFFSSSAVSVARAFFCWYFVVWLCRLCVLCSQFDSGPNGDNMMHRICATHSHFIIYGTVNTLRWIPIRKRPPKHSIRNESKLKFNKSELTIYMPNIKDVLRARSFARMEWHFNGVRARSSAYQSIISLLSNCERIECPISDITDDWWRENYQPHQHIFEHLHLIVGFDGNRIIYGHSGIVSSSILLVIVNFTHKKPNKNIYIASLLFFFRSCAEIRLWIGGDWKLLKAKLFEQ